MACSERITDGGGMIGGGAVSSEFAVVDDRGRREVSSVREFMIS